MQIKVFKFGGASVKSAEAVKNVGHILSLFPNQPLLVVVSAMGKTTNAFEELVKAYMSGKDCIGILNERKVFHQEIASGLFPENHAIFLFLDAQFSKLQSKLETPASDNYDFEYDQIVSWGEVFSTQIVHAFLEYSGVNTKWLDARRLVRTDNTWREGRIDWDKTSQLIQKEVSPWLLHEKGIAIVQGFVGHTPELFTTTLGREGSDFTAAIFAWCLDADSVTIWKDVPGVLNADPKWFDNTVKLDKISFREAIELTYYGATIIHPRTIKPLENKNIPLYARSFVNPTEEGTCISHDDSKDKEIPSFIFKINQVLVSITPKDFSFIMEDHLSEIFSQFSKLAVRINLMQNSAINFSVCVDWDDRRIPALIEALGETYTIKYNTGLELVTIRHWNDATVQRVTTGKEILVDQRTRATARMVMRDHLDVANG
jgi:aspartate kinase